MFKVETEILRNIRRVLKDGKVGVMVVEGGRERGSVVELLEVLEEDFFWKD